jgi:hypothetical protein
MITKSQFDIIERAISDYANNNKTKSREFRQKYGFNYATFLKYYKIYKNIRNYLSNYFKDEKLLTEIAIKVMEYAFMPKDNTIKIGHEKIV